MLLSHSLYWYRVKKYELKTIEEKGLFISPADGCTKDDIDWYSPYFSYPNILMDFIDMIKKIDSLYQRIGSVEFGRELPSGRLYEEKLKNKYGLSVWGKLEKEQAEILLEFVSKYGLFGICGNAFSVDSQTKQEDFILSYQEPLSELMLPGQYFHQGKSKFWRLANHIKIWERFKKGGYQPRDIYSEKPKLTWGDVISEFELPETGGFSLVYKESNFAIEWRTNSLIDELIGLYTSMLLGQVQKIGICEECGLAYPLYFDKTVSGQRNDSGFCSELCANRGRVRKSRDKAKAIKLHNEGKSIEEIAELLPKRDVGQIMKWLNL